MSQSELFANNPKLVEAFIMAHAALNVILRLLTTTKAEFFPQKNFKKKGK